MFVVFLTLSSVKLSGFKITRLTMRPVKVYCAMHVQINHKYLLHLPIHRFGALMRF